MAFTCERALAIGPVSMQWKPILFRAPFTFLKMYKEEITSHCHPRKWANTFWR